MLVVELLFHDLAWKRLLANPYLHRCIEGGIIRIDERHAHTLVCRNGVVSGRHLTYPHTVFEHLISMTGYRLVGKLYSYNLLPHATGFLAEKRLTADKPFLVELTEETETGHKRRYVGRKLVSV